MPTPNHCDAIGYLKALAANVNEPWFAMVCDLAIVSGKSTLDQPDLATLLALFTERASYLGMTPVTAPTVPAAAPPPADFLEELSGFSNFKLLGCTLDMKFTKRITLTFGANGSGKSSLCEALKVLASSERPSRPLDNVREPATTEPGFNYKFKSDAAVQSWTPTVGYGPRSPSIKYFDAGIAVRNVKSAVEPGRIIELTPFKLHVFELAKALVTEFRGVLQAAKEANAARLSQALEDVRAKFGKFVGRPLEGINEKTLAVLPEEMKKGEAFSQHDILREKQAAAAELEKALSEEGLKLLKAEHRELDAFLSSLKTLLDKAEQLWRLEPAAKAKELAEKEARQELLARALIPENGTLEGLLSLLHAVSTLCNFESPADQTCPLCKRKLDGPEMQLFKKYHELLTDELEKQITSLRADLRSAAELAKEIGELDRNDWDKSSTLSKGMLAEAKAGAEVIVDNCDPGEEPTPEARAVHESLLLLSAKGTQVLEQKANAIEAAEKGREELEKQLAALRSEIDPLKYAQSVAEHLTTLKEVQHLADGFFFWSSKLPSFTPLLKKITDAAKEAHEDLVVGDFEARLDGEYKALAEKSMIAFGVKLAKRGSDASVTVLPQIGGKELEGVLSEGEQRVHALALFFAELETCPQSVLIFDDPVSSFDYNYMANCCARLRDFALNHPARQIIILTHNWEFFVQLQLILNAAGLNNDLSVQVLENCTVVADYSEKVDELKRDIETILARPGEPSTAQKEEMAGKMRRLIEAVVNTHVFNNQRHQFKQKGQPVAAFHSFTKLVPLLPAEATTLGDLYSKLSIPEHDDPRNAYVNTDKAAFQSRYDGILAIETAVTSRK